MLLFHLHYLWGCVFFPRKSLSFTGSWPLFLTLGRCQHQTLQIPLLSCWSPLPFCLECDRKPLKCSERDRSQNTIRWSAEMAAPAGKLRRGGDNLNPVGSSWAEQSTDEQSSGKSSSDLQGDPTVWCEVHSGSRSTWAQQSSTTPAWMMQLLGVCLSLLFITLGWGGGSMSHSILPSFLWRGEGMVAYSPRLGKTHTLTCRECLSAYFTFQWWILFCG